MKLILILSILFVSCTTNHIENKHEVQAIKKTKEGRFAKITFYTYKTPSMTDTTEIHQFWVRCGDDVNEGDTLEIKK